MSAATTKYLKHIDGLRALAVILVICFHFDIPGFSAGYIGVDIFFVISGFVISRLLLNEISATNSIDLRDFYKRRIRRIFPALLFTFAITTAGSLVLFAPENLVQYGGSLAAAALSVSNLLFWYESGYFDTASHLKPLLHTWSLGVEEQFYLAWPLLLLFFFRIRLMLLGVLALFFLSFFLNYVWVKSAHPEAASTLFFVTPFRVFQFAIGACCVFLERAFKPGNIIQELQCALGLSLVAYSAVTLDKDSIFPYINALPLCLGTGLLILSGGSKLSKILFENKLALSIGLLSYSLYLMHWPVFVFTKYVYVNMASAKFIVAMLVLTAILAAISYFFVERPFRKPRSEWQKYWIYRGSLTMMALFILLGLMMKFSDGWTWRHKNEPLSASEIEQGKSNRYKYTQSACSVLELDNQEKCPMDRPIQMLVLGNSHEPDGFNTFHYLYGDNKQVNLIKFGTVNSCPFEVKDGNMSSPEEALNCSARFSALNQQQFINKITHVVYSTHTGFDPVARQLWDILESLMHRNKQVKLIALGSYLETSLECSTIRNNLGTFDACKMPEYVTYFNPDEREASPISQAKVLPYLYISKLELLCPGMQLSACDTYANGEPMFYDRHHLSLGFSYHLGKLIAEKYDQALIDIGLPPRLNP